MLVSNTVVAPVNVMSEVKPSDLSSRREPTRAMAVRKYTVFSDVSECRAADSLAKKAGEYV